MLKITINDGVGNSEMRRNAICDYRWCNQLRKISNDIHPSIAVPYANEISSKYISAAAYYTALVYHLKLQRNLEDIDFGALIHISAVAFHDGESILNALSSFIGSLKPSDPIFNENPTEYEYLEVFNALYDEVMRLTKGI